VNGPAPPPPPPPGHAPAGPLDPVRVSLRVNGQFLSAAVEPRTSLADLLRDQGLTGTKLGCEQGACGSCTVHLDGEPVRACLTLAVQTHGAEVTTVEGLDNDALKASFHAHHALQCGFCTAGFLMTADAYLREHPDPTEDELKEALAGNLCRCTGYRPIVRAILQR
jgi:aerobic-type carbon monoxide dehydrogenase small subunit (CoxS/CutS family)